MTIQVDSREKPKAIKKILSHFENLNIKYFVSKLPVGDYMCLDNARLCIDRKQNLSELCGNVTQQHARFVREIKKAEEYGIQLIFLCEHGDDITTLDDIKDWQNPRIYHSPKATTGKQLFKILNTMKIRHENISFEFCKKDETGKRIIELLGGNNE